MPWANLSFYIYRKESLFSSSYFKPNESHLINGSVSESVNNTMHSNSGRHFNSSSSSSLSSPNAYTSSALFKNYYDQLNDDNSLIDCTSPRPKHGGAARHQTSNNLIHFIEPIEYEFESNSIDINASFTNSLNMNGEQQPTKLINIENNDENNFDDEEQQAKLIIVKSLSNSEFNA